ncbi:MULTISPECIES: glycosyltransferase family 2 protein [unclassified Sutcliffiella]|uniref:teichuronic acid biosynthesis protein TuaG n=1 Tax=unclassified Sutcliffiella TaxID=2837532 RepID=UPI0030D2B4D7
MSSPLVSVITPSYNAERFIAETIESVKKQTFTDWEMIIVDDCSSDNTREILQDYAANDPRIKPIFLKENSGAAVARNTALNEAKGDYVAFLDSDDFWLPEKLEKQLAFMQQHNHAFSYTAYNLMDESGNLLDKVIRIPSEIDYKGLLKNTIIGCLTVMIDRRQVGQLQMPLIRTRQDYALWLQVLRDGYIAYGIQEPLSNYRLVEGSISSNKLKAAKRNWYVYRHIEKLSIPYASWCLINYAYYAVKKRIQA